MMAASGAETYLRQAFTAPLLTVCEEQELSRRFRGSGDPAALDRLVTSHLRLVVKVATRYRRSNVAFEDLVSEGCVGLLEAARHFDPDKGFRFATYARWWIRSQIAAYVSRTSSIVRAGRRRSEFDGLGNAEESDGEPGLAEWATSRRHDIALTDASLADVEDLLVDPTPSIEIELVERERFEIHHRILEGALGGLGERERRIFTARHLLEKPRTLEQLGRELGISRERVRQIDGVAWQKLRHRVGEAVKLQYQTSPGAPLRARHHVEVIRFANQA